MTSLFMVVSTEKDIRIIVQGNLVIRLTGSEEEESPMATAH